MFGKGRPDHDIEGLGACLIIAAALNDLRSDPEAFARLLLALARAPLREKGESPYSSRESSEATYAREVGIKR